ncbi:MAG: PEP-CTERM sorting domain-containing protein [Candidatus Tectimicrobiota bacterium]
MFTRSVLLLCWLLGLTVLPAQALSIHLLPSARSLLVGQTFTVDIVLTELRAGRDPADEVLAFGLNTILSAPIVQLLDTTLAPPFVAPAMPLDDTDIAGLAFPGLRSDPLLLATLTLQALSPGMTTLETLTDPDLNLNHGLFFALSPDPVALNASLALTVVTPEPATLLLLGSSLLGLLACRWRRLGWR